MRLLQRFICEVSVDRSGQLHADGVWNLEPARWETHLHRDVARLAPATDEAIARFASAHGLLRMRASAYVNSGSQAEWAQGIMRFAQERWPQAEAAIAWARGEQLTVPQEARDLAGWLTYVAATTPRPLLRYMRALMRDESPPSTRDEAAELMRGHALPVTRLPDVGGLQPTQEDLALAADIFEPFAFAMATARTPGLRADDPTFSEMISGLFVAAPEVMEQLVADPRALETVAESADDWRTAATGMAQWIQLLNLLQDARSNGLSPSEKRELRGLLSELLNWAGPRDMTPAELADRCLPLFVLRVEEELTRHGAWPPSMQAPLPTYVRALVALWREATSLAAPRPCVTAGCGGTVAGSSKARYCDACRRDRQRKRVQARRRAV